MKGSQEIKEITALGSGDVELELLYGYNIILTPEEVLSLIEKLESRLPVPYTPAVHIKCEIHSDGIIGSTDLNVIRVEKEDDGSYTAVTDYWPKN